MEIPVIAAAWLLAIALTGVAGAPWWGGAAVMVALVPVGGLLGGKRMAVATGIGVVAALVAGSRFDAWLDRPAPPLAAFVGAEVILEGTIVSEPDPGLTVTRYVVSVGWITVEGDLRTATSGRVLASLHQYDEFLPGDRLELRGTIEEAEDFDGFAYRRYLLQRGVVGTMFRPQVTVLDTGGGLRREITALRLRMDRALQRALPEPEASLAGGIAVGRDEGLANDVAGDFREAGLAHLLAVSGSNIVILTGGTLALATRFLPRRRAVAVAAVLAAGYLVLAGVEASVLRAGVMAAVFLAGDLLGRPQAGLAALGVAVIALTLPDPGVAADVGFQLSASATAGLIAFTPWLTSAIRSLTERGRTAGLVPGLLVDQAAITLAASIATTPVVWATFGRVAPLAPIANIVGAPLFNLAFVASLVCGLVGLVSEDAARVTGLLAYYPLTILRSLAGFAADIPGVSLDPGRADAEVALAFGAVIAAAGLLAYRRLAPAVPSAHVSARIRAAQVSTAAILLVPLVAGRSLAPIGGPGEFVMTVLDVGQGDAILLRTPSGRSYLIDGGPSGARLAQQLGAVLPHWQRQIDYVLLTHPQEDHVGGLASVLRRYSAGETAGFGSANATQSHQAFLERTGTIRRLAAGDSWTDDGVRFEVVWPPPGYDARDLNDESLILLVTYGATTFLLTGDAEGVPLRAIAADLGAVTVLKVPHHGSKTTPASFFGVVAPQVAVISAGAGNRFGHPAPETLESLAATLTLRTDLHGRVEVRSDGERIRYRTQR